MSEPGDRGTIEMMGKMTTFMAPAEIIEDVASEVTTEMASETTLTMTPEINTEMTLEMVPDVSSEMAATVATELVSMITPVVVRGATEEWDQRGQCTTIRREVNHLRMNTRKVMKTIFMRMKNKMTVEKVVHRRMMSFT